MTDLLERPIEIEDVDDLDAPDAPRPPKPPWGLKDATWRNFERAVTLIVVGGATLFTIMHLHPELLVKNTTPAGGDMGAHVWGPAYLRDHILPHFRLSGWAPDWYAGFPMYQFYMVLPALLVVGLNLLLPYGVALKLISVLGLVSLPVACWAFGRLAGLKRPAPEVLSVAAVFFLFDETFRIYGGNVASTMAGEFSFSIALSFAVLFIGLFAYSLRTGRRRVLAAIVFALCVLSHGIVAIFAAVGALIMWICHVDGRHAARFLRERFPSATHPLVPAGSALVAVGALALVHAPKIAFLAVVGLAVAWYFLADIRRGLLALSIGVTGGLLSMFWLLPFVGRQNYLTDMFYERRPTGNTPDDLRKDSYWEMFFPQQRNIDRLLFVLAAIGFISSCVRRKRAGIWLGITALTFGVWAGLWPQSHLWNARLLPFMYLCRYMLVALGLLEVGYALARLIKPNDFSLTRIFGLVTAVAIGLAGFIGLGFKYQTLPLGTRVKDASGNYTGQFTWGPFSVHSSSIARAWAEWNYKGYEEKSAYAEYYGIVTTMANLGKTNGCGRALWENNNDEDKYGTPMALMLLPYWTNGCIGSMEGLYFEASGTTPYHFITTSALSKNSSNPVRRLVYENGQVGKGVEYLKSLGVRYYLAYNDSVVSQADTNPELTKVAESGPWKVYEVKDHDIVTPLTVQPVVLSDSKIGTDRDRWLEVGTSYFQNQASWGAMPAASGPKDWARISLTTTGKTDDRTLAKVAPSQPIVPKALDPVAVSNITTGDDRVSFDVDKIGVPVLVKVSYFPNWKVSGGTGPYRVAPNLMLVVPTSKHVSLHYGYTNLDLFAYLLTFVGIVGAVWLWRWAPAISVRTVEDGELDEDDGTGDGGDGIDGPGELVAFDHGFDPWGGPSAAPPIAVPIGDGSVPAWVPPGTVEGLPSPPPVAPIALPVAPPWQALPPPSDALVVDWSDGEADGPGADR